MSARWRDIIGRGVERGVTTVAPGQRGTPIGENCAGTPVRLGGSRLECAIDGEAAVRKSPEPETCLASSTRRAREVFAARQIHLAQDQHMTQIENISDTARWVAVYRAMETERPDAIFRDPFAARLAGDTGRRSSTR